LYDLYKDNLIILYNLDKNNGPEFSASSNYMYNFEGNIKPKVITKTNRQNMNLHV